MRFRSRGRRGMRRGRGRRSFSRGRRSRRRVGGIRIGYRL